MGLEICHSSMMRNFELFTFVLAVIAGQVSAHLPGYSRCPGQCIRVQYLNPDSYNFQAGDINLFLSGIPELTRQFSRFETPIQFHKTTTIAASFYNLVSAYDETALDFFGEARTRFLACCNSDDQLQVDTHRSMAIVYAWLHLARNFGFQEKVEGIAEAAMVPLNKFDTSTDPSTPHGWAKLVTEEFVEYTRTDGWNELGLDSKTFNPMPYEDTTGYCPDLKDPTRWKPLRTSDGLGAFHRQLHVTPHIGHTGRLYVLNASEFMSREAPEPHYQYGLEVRSLLRRSAALGRSPREQAKVELYDQKFVSLVPLLVAMGLQMPSSSRNILDFMSYVLSIDVAAQEATMLVWKEKVRFDKVRPPTRVIQELGLNTNFTAFAGPGKGTRRISSKEWQPFISTMPHSEYPSASACLCQASMEVGEEFNGGYDISHILPTIALNAGESKVQSGLPWRRHVFRYKRTYEIVRDCSNSRLTGGLHFTLATSAGRRLCEGLGSQTVGKMFKLVAGDTSGKFGDRNDEKPSVRPGTNREDGNCLF